MVEPTIYNISDSKKELHRRLRSKQRMPRLIRWLREKYPYHGETLIYNFILDAAKQEKVVFSERSIRRATGQEQPRVKNNDIYTDILAQKTNSRQNTEATN